MQASDRIIQKIFSSQLSVLQSGKQPLKNIKAISAIARCRTGELGTSYYSCKDRHELRAQEHACHHRSCYICAGKRQQKWIEKQKGRLLNCPHFHVIFTLPHEYLGLWRYNEKWFTKALFKISRDSLLELMEDKRYHEVRPGILMALHTWGRQANLHPHTHCLVTAGGLDKHKAWKETGKFLLPIRVLKSLYRGKFQAYIMEARNKGEITLPPDMSREAFQRCYRSAYRKDWSVRIEERYEHGKGVLIYLARYMKGGPIKPSQIKYSNTKEVVYRYKDHRDGKIKESRLRIIEFIRRLLLHVPAMGVHTIRYYGVYAPAAKKLHQQCKERLGTLAGESNTGLALSDRILCCRQCGKPAERIHIAWRRNRKGNSLIKKRDTIVVQQADEPDIEKVSLYDST